MINTLSWFKEIIDVWNNVDMWQGIWATIKMVTISTLIAYLIGIPIGICVICTDQGGLFPNKVINKILGFIINLGRSIPFVIMLVALIPITQLVMGTSIGVRGMILPLSIGAIPFVARLVETSFREINTEVIDAAKCMGCRNIQIIFKVYLVEAIPSLIRGISITLIMLVGYSAMSGYVGGEGLGHIAIQYGYYQYDTITMIIVLIVIIIIVHVFQFIFGYTAKKINKSKGE